MCSLRTEAYEYAYIAYSNLTAATLRVGPVPRSRCALYGLRRLAPLRRLVHIGSGPTSSGASESVDRYYNHSFDSIHRGPRFPETKLEP